jgi:hypothetical protein
VTVGNGVIGSRGSRKGVCVGKGTAVAVDVGVKVVEGTAVSVWEGIRVETGVFVKTLVGVVVAAILVLVGGGLSSDVHPTAKRSKRSNK